MTIQYKLKPVVIEAVQWKGNNMAEMEEFGVLVVLDSLKVGSYITKDAKGKFKVHTYEAFHEMYERHLVWDENL